MEKGNKRKYVLKKRMQLRLVIAITIIGSFGAGLLLLGLNNFFIGEFSIYTDDALAIAIINGIMTPFYILPIVCGYDFSKKLWRVGNRRIKKIAKDILE